MPPSLDGPSIHPCLQSDFRTRAGHGSAAKREVLAKRGYQLKAGQFKAVRGES